LSRFAATSSITLRRTIVVAFMAWAFSLSGLSLAQQAGSPWETLTEKTGWLPLGDRSADDKEWTVCTFRVYPNQSDWPINPPPSMPRYGDQIELTSASVVNVFDYRATGERMRFVVPERSQLKDLTDVMLPKAAVVVVRSLRLQQHPTGGQTVWARVSPVDFDDSRFRGWERLQHQTGWIHLGDALKYTNGVLGKLEHFGFLPAPDPIPAVGARVSLRAPAAVYLRDFLTAGEAKRLEVPNAVRPFDSRAYEVDFADAVLPKGSVLEILEMKQGPSNIGGYVAFWARVKPPRKH
jgi:hypothetical protein